MPLGATEQHGPHLPLETDTVIASDSPKPWRRALRVTCAGPAVRLER